MENMKVQLKEMLENWKKPHWPKIILFISSSLAGFTLILIILEYTRRIGSLARTFPIFNPKFWGPELKRIPYGPYSMEPQALLKRFRDLN